MRLWAVSTPDAAGINGIEVRKAEQFVSPNSPTVAKKLIPFKLAADFSFVRDYTYPFTYSYEEDQETSHIRSLVASYWY